MRLLSVGTFSDCSNLIAEITTTLAEYPSNPGGWCWGGLNLRQTDTEVWELLAGSEMGHKEVAEIVAHSRWHN